MSKKSGLFKLTKLKLVTMLVVVVIGVTLIVSVYNQNQSNKKAQDVILQQKEAAIKTENQKQADLDKKAEQKKLDDQKALDQEKKLEQQKILDDEKKAAAEKAKKEAEAAATAAAIAKEKAKYSKPTQEVAVEIVSKIIIKKDAKAKVSYDHMQNRDGKDYYVIHAYDDMTDHINTLGWYYVQVDTGKAFEWDLIKDTLTPIN